MRRFLAWVEAFPPGRVPLLLLILAVVSGSATVLRGTGRGRYDLTIWTFAHVACAEFEQRLRDRVDHDRIHLINLGRAMTDRLSLGVMTGKELPDLVEVEQSEVGRYFRGPVEAVPFVDLTDRIRSEGWDRRCVATRFAKYSTRGRIFGIPHDLHPVVVVYRPDVLNELGGKPEQLVLWEDWIRFGQRVYRPGPKGSSQWRFALGLLTVEAGDYLLLLWQRGGDIFDEGENVTIDSELAVQTLEFYVSLLVSERPTAGARLSGWNEDFAALARGQFVGLVFPDYMLATMRLEADSILGGKVHCMPLPAWEPGGRRTSTIGGTMMGIPRACRDPDRAWELAKFLYFDRESLVRRFRDLSILPPLRTAYNDPVFDEPVPFFGGQRVGRLLTELADDVPPVRGSPYTPEALALLNAVFADVVEGRTAPREALAGVAGKLRRIMQRDRAALDRRERGAVR